MAPTSRPLALRAGSLLAAGLLIGGLILAAPVALLAHQADCALGTYVVSDDECQISTPVTATGTRTFGHALHILAGGSIDARGGGITLDINGVAGLNFTMDAGTSVDASDTGASNNDASPITIKATGNMLMGAGSKVTAENNTGGGDGGAISIDVDGDMTLAGHSGATHGALISSRKTAGAGDTGVGGSISIKVGDTTTATGDLTLGGGGTAYGSETGARIDATGTGPSGDLSINVAGNYNSAAGSVVASGGANGTSIQQGGKIYIVAGCDLTTRGRITSKGRDPGADLVHLEGCHVVIQGLVESTGKGHTVSNNPDATGPPSNSCDGNNDGLPGEIIRSGKPRNATGCIEVWGKTITIDSTHGWSGELNADIGNGGPDGTSWIDIYALSSLVVTDGTGNDRTSDNLGHTYLSTYAVHANAINGSDHSTGVVTAKVKEGPSEASGKAYQASTTGNGSDGGTIDVEASGKVTLDNAFLDASGDLDDSPNVDGGNITVKAWGTGSNLSWKPGDGDVRPPVGTITLNACGTILTDGTTESHGVTPATSNDCDSGKPSIPGFVQFNVDQWAKCDKAEPTLKIDKTPDGGIVTAGNPASFTITVTNRGPGTVDGVVIDDTLPASGHTWSVNPDKSECTIVDNKLHCDVGSLADGADFSVTVSTATDSEGCKTLENTATADGTEVAKVSDTGSVTIQCQDLKPDVTITKTGNGTINAGDNAVFTITATNLGPGSADDVTVKDDLPTGITWSLGGPDADSCTITTGHLSCTFGTVAEADTRTITLTGETDQENCGHVKNTAVVDASNEDEGAVDNNSANDTIIVNCEVAPLPLLTIEKAVSGTTPGVGGIKTTKPGDTLTYTLSYHLTNGPVDNGVITDKIPAGLTFSAGTASNNAEFTFDSYNAGTRVLTWKAVSVSTDGSVTYNVVVAAGAPALVQPLTNVATIDSEATAPDQATLSVFAAAPVRGETSPPTAPPTDTIGAPHGGTVSADYRLLMLLALAGVVMILASTIHPNRMRRRDRRD